MKLGTLAGVVGVFVGLLTVAAKAEVEVIGPITIVPNQPVTLHFGNAIPPDPDHKILDFTGKAQNLSTGLDAILWVGFDYTTIDPATGQLVDVPLPPQQFVILPGSIADIQLHTVLPFCPDRVSLDFRLVDLGGAAGQAVQVGGHFLHECVAVPEPATAMLGTLTVGLLALRRRSRA